MSQESVADNDDDDDDDVNVGINCGYDRICCKIPNLLPIRSSATAVKSTINKLF